MSSSPTVNPQSDSFTRTYRIRVALFLGAVLALLVLLGAIYRGINTFVQLEIVEHERDQWQRPAPVLQALNLREGSTVVDLGSGAGYFALKLSRAAGSRGRVLAVDIRRLPLLFLWIRAVLGSHHNITVIHAHESDPNLPAGVADAVLVANTYHEFSNPKAILGHVARSLVPGGRLVVLDRSPPAPNAQHDETEGHHHHLPAAEVERELLQSGFEIVSREDNFIEQQGKDSWWLIVARRP